MNKLLVLALLVSFIACGKSNNTTNDPSDIAKFGIQSASIDYYTKNKQQFNLPVETANKIYQAIKNATKQQAKTTLTIQNSTKEPSSNTITFQFEKRKEVFHVWSVASLIAKIDPMVKKLQENKLYKLSKADSKTVADILNEFCRKNVTILKPEEN